jgi:hypothetical protein
MPPGTVCVKNDSVVCSSMTLVVTLHHGECFGRVQFSRVYLTLMPSGCCVYHIFQHQNCIFPTQWVCGFRVIHRRTPYHLFLWLALTDCIVVIEAQCSLWHTDWTLPVIRIIFSLKVIKQWFDTEPPAYCLVVVAVCRDASRFLTQVTVADHGRNY